MLNKVEVVRAGLMTTVQDTGRIGYAHLGLPRSGCLDSYSQCLANYLVSNASDAAVLEVTLQGPELVFQAATVVGMAGAHFDVYINDVLQIPNKTWVIEKGDILRFGRLHSGCRAYLAVQGGWQVSKELQSRSTFLLAKLGGKQGRSLQQGDCLSLTNNKAKFDSKSIPIDLLIDYSRHHVIRVVDGMESQWFSQQARDMFVSKPFVVTADSNRMGYRLQGEKVLERDHKQEMLTTAVVPGTVQVPDNGKPIIVLADGQTTGGYARIANIISADIHLLGQYKPGDEMRFFKVSQEKALLLFRQKQALLKTLYENTST